MVRAPRASATETRRWPSRTAYASPTCTPEIGGRTLPPVLGFPDALTAGRVGPDGRNPPSKSGALFGSRVPAIASSEISRTPRPARRGRSPRGGVVTDRKPAALTAGGARQRLL